MRAWVLFGASALLGQLLVPGCLERGSLRDNCDDADHVVSGFLPGGSPEGQRNEHPFTVPAGTRTLRLEARYMFEAKATLSYLEEGSFRVSSEMGPGRVGPVDCQDQRGDRIAAIADRDEEWRLEVSTTGEADYVFYLYFES